MEITRPHSFPMCQLHILPGFIVFLNGGKCVIVITQTQNGPTATTFSDAMNTIFR